MLYCTASASAVQFSRCEVAGSAWKDARQTLVVSSPNRVGSVVWNLWHLPKHHHLGDDDVKGEKQEGEKKARVACGTRK